jgi:hypothetical protein
MPRSRRVCLLIDTSTSWGIRLIKGISRHANEVGNWLIHVEPWGRYERFHMPEGWNGHGIIARVNRQSLAKEISESGLPAINLSWHPFQGERIARCTPIILCRQALRTSAIADRQSNFTTKTR